MSLILDEVNSGSSSMVASVVAKLESLGWSPAEIADVMPEISSGVMADISETDVDDMVEATKSDAEAAVTNAYSTMLEMEVQQISDAISSGHKVQDARLKLVQPEPIAPLAGGVNLPASTYSVDEDNNQSYNFVDDAKNWFKVNKKTKLVEALFANGVILKMDGSGNCTIRVPGSLKYIVDGDRFDEVKGNYTVAVHGTKSETVVGSVTEKYGNQTTLGGAFIKMDAAQIDIA